MEEVIKYFETIESRLSAAESKLTDLSTCLQQQTERLTAMESRLAEISERLAEVSLQPSEHIVNDDIQLALAALTTRIQTLEQQREQPYASAPQSQNTEMIDDEVIAIDDETGLPELEVELVEDEVEEKIEVEEKGEVEKPADSEKIIDGAVPAAAVTHEETEVPAEHQESAASTEPKKEAIADKQDKPTVLDAAQQDTLSAIIPKVEDIKKAISLGDRFLFQRELFNGNGELMTKTIEALNKLSSLDEAMSYIERFGWNKESNAYELFTNILKRRW